MLKVRNLLMVSKITICVAALIVTAISEVKAHPLLPPSPLHPHHLAVVPLFHHTPVVQNTVHLQLIRSLSSVHHVTRAAEAAAPYVHWLSSSTHQAELAAANARAASAAFEAAHAAVVPPPLIAANRVHLASLAATNIFGQNTPAIAAAEARYEEFWARDVSMLHGYHHEP